MSFILRNLFILFIAFIELIFLLEDRIILAYATVNTQNFVSHKFNVHKNYIN